MRTFRWTWPLLALAACAGDTGSDTMVQTLSVPARVDATFIAPTCAVAVDGSIRLTGELSLGGLDARLIFRNNQKGTHEHAEDLSATTVLIPADATIDIPASSLQGAPGVAPAIFVQFFDAGGNAVTAELFLGDCDATGFPASASVALTTTVRLTVSATGCSNHPGPTITVDGAVEFAGLDARIVVRAADGSEAGAVVARADIVTLAAGETLAIPKQPSRGGVGGNPWIWAQLIDVAGAPLTDELFVGRCGEL